MRICDAVRTMRVERKLTQWDVAKGLNVSQSAVSAIEKGVRKPSYEMLEKLAEFFNVPLSELLRDTDDVPDDSESTTAQFIHRNPKQKVLFDKTKHFSDEDMDVILSVVSAIAKERGV